MSGPKANPWIEKIGVYVPGRATAKPGRKLVKLSSNEAALGASPKAITAFAETASMLHHYPDGGHWALRDALAGHYGLDAGRIIVGNGSDEVLNLVGAAFAGPGDEILFADHSFAMYPIIAQKTQATAVIVPDPDFTADVDAMLAAVTERTKVVFLANPNNPTGTLLSGADVRRLHAGLPEHVVFVLDAAYAEFVEDPDYETGFKLADEHKNVVVTRTFSKIYGLAGLRCGWGYFSQEVFEATARLRDPFNVNLPAQAAAIAALADQDHMRKARDHNNDWLKRLTQMYRGLGLEVVPSAANFLLVGFPDPEHPAREADAWLTSNGIMVRYLPGHGFQNHLRITIGTEEENRLVVAALEAFLQGARA